MATNQSFIDHVLAQAGLGERLRSRKMFGEYGFHLDGKFIALGCDKLCDTADLLPEPKPKKPKARKGAKK